MIMVLGEFGDDVGESTFAQGQYNVAIITSTCEVRRDFFCISVSNVVFGMTSCYLYPSNCAEGVGI